MSELSPAQLRLRLAETFAALLAGTFHAENASRGTAQPLPREVQHLVNRFSELLGKIGSASAHEKSSHAGLIPQNCKSELLTYQWQPARDVRWVAVMVKPESVRYPELESVTLGYSPDVAGTDLVYDITGEFLQGKARPFEVNLAAVPFRIYCLLPFQLEQWNIMVPQQPLFRKTAEKEVKAPLLASADKTAAAITVSHFTQLGEPLAAVLPVRCTLLGKSGEVLETRDFLTSEKSELFIDAARLTPEQTLVVHSPLEGEEVAWVAGEATVSKRQILRDAFPGLAQRQFARVGSPQ